MHESVLYYFKKCLIFLFFNRVKAVWHFVSKFYFTNIDCISYLFWLHDKHFISHRLLPHDNVSLSLAELWTGSLGRWGECLGCTRGFRRSYMASGGSHEGKQKEREDGATWGAAEKKDEERWNERNKKWIFNSNKIVMIFC